MLTVGSCFAGIDGLGLGLEWTGGFEVRWQIESDPHASAILEARWPRVRRYGDIRLVNPAELEPVDAVVGGFPCQPASVAGKRLGQADERWLWPEFARILGGVRPRLAIVENVPGLASRGMGEVLGDLAELGFDAEWDVLPASAFGAPHVRERIFIVAYAHGAGRSEQRGAIAVEAEQRPAERGSRALVNADSEGREHSQEGDARSGLASSGPADHRAPSGPSWWDFEPNVDRVADGVPARVDRLRRLGNAIVPQVAQGLGRMILTALNGRAA